MATTSDNPTETTIRVEKKYLDNMINYVEKLENYCETCNRRLDGQEDIIGRLKSKIRNVERKNRRIKNEIKTLRMERIENRLENDSEDLQFKEEWVLCDEEENVIEQT